MAKRRQARWLPASRHCGSTQGEERNWCDGDVERIDELDGEHRHGAGEKRASGLEAGASDPGYERQEPEEAGGGKDLDEKVVRIDDETMGKALRDIRHDDGTDLSRTHPEQRVVYDRTQRQMPEL
jgi:hypothetical protein